MTDKQKLIETIKNLEGHINNVHTDMERSELVDQADLNTCSMYVQTGLMWMRRAAHSDTPPEEQEAA